MARLMQRVRGEAMPPAPRRERRKAQEPATPEPVAPPPTPVVEAVAAPPVPELTDTLQELVPRTKAPEKNDLSKMRDLANQQTRIAIDKSSRRQAAGEIVNRWITSGVSGTLAAAIGLLGSSGNRVAMLGMFAGFTVSAYYAWLAIWTARRLFPNRREHERRATPRKP